MKGARCTPSCCREARLHASSSFVPKDGFGARRRTVVIEGLRLNFAEMHTLVAGRCYGYKILRHAQIVHVGMRFFPSYDQQNHRSGLRCFGIPMLIPDSIIILLILFSDFYIL